jgi:predicted ATPase
MICDVHQLRRDFAAADEALTEASGLIAHTGERWCEAEIYRCQAVLRHGNPGGAEDLLHRALEIARRQSAKIFELRAASDLARCWAARGRGLDARALLAPICGWFAEDCGADDLRRARALLVAL